LIQDTQVIVKVKDTGTPIYPDILPQLFSKFASKSFEDTGLVLFIANSIVEAHYGKIWAENNNINTQRERGDTFSFTLPTINRQQNVKAIDQYNEQENIISRR
jgi:two-component system, OmpR family, sensor histidine kinase VicK